MYLGIWILIDNFGNINGWSFYEVMFLYNVNLFSYGISGLLLWIPMKQVEGLVHNGDFDLYMTKPMNILLHLISKNFTHPFFGHIILSIFIFILIFINMSISLNLFQVLMFCLSLFGATLIQISIMIIGGSINFWLIKASTFLDIMIYGLRGFISYPISIYTHSIQFILTFALPYAFINYYPVMIVFPEKSSEMLFNKYLSFGTPVIGAIMFIIALRIWNIGIKNYQSTGS